MLHQELVRAATIVAVILLGFGYYMKPQREATKLKRDCGMMVEPSKITDEMRNECARYLKEIQKYRN